MKKIIAILLVAIAAFASGRDSIFDKGEVVWLPAMTGTVNGSGYIMGLAPDGAVVWRRYP